MPFILLFLIVLIIFIGNVIYTPLVWNLILVGSTVVVLSKFSQIRQMSTARKVFGILGSAGLAVYIFTQASSEPNLTAMGIFTIVFCGILIASLF